MRYRFLWLWLFSLSAKLVLAQAVLDTALSTAQDGQANQYVLNAEMPVHPLDAHAEILIDSTGELSFDQVRFEDNWQPLGESLASYGDRYSGGYFELGASAYFSRLELITDRPLDGWQLHFEDRLHHNIAWIRGNGRVEVRAYAGGELLWTRMAGADIPTAERDVKDRRTLNRVRLDGLPTQTPISLITRFEPNSFGFPAYSNASIRAPGFLDYHPLYSKSVLFNALVFGATTIMFIAHLLLFVYLRERVHGWLALWLLFAALTHAMTIGVEPVAWLPFHHPDLRVALWILVPSNMLFSFWLFGRAFVQTARKYPRIDKAMIAIPLTMAVLTVVQVIRILVFDVPRPFTNLPGLYVSIGILAVASLVLAIVLANRRGDALALYFGVGALVASGFLILAGLWAQRVIVLGVDPFAVGTLAQVIVYSFGLAYRNQLSALAAAASQWAAERAESEMARMRDLDEVKARFFANVSHEFRTPLSLVMGPLVRAYKRSKKHSSSKEVEVTLNSDEYDVIVGNTQRLEVLVDQLLDLSHLEHGGVFLQLRRGGLIPFLKSLLGSFESLAERAGIGLSATFPKDYPKAFYDEDKLSKIISNLLSNALKYTPSRGTVSVHVDCEPTHFTVEVTDTGPGIKAEEIEHIFDRFYRVSGTEASGSGIGLALTKELVDLHGGTIAVRSSLGQGTTFRVRLPHTLADLPDGLLTVAKDGGHAPDGMALATKPPSSPPSSAQQEKAAQVHEQAALILVVEDNEQLRRFIGELLADHYNVLTASDGLQGERMATEHVPDLVISDVMMPKQDGYALCHALKVNPKTSHVPVVLLTARSDHSSALEGLTQGADDYLTKPFDAEELLLRVRNLLAGRERLWAHFQSLDLTLLPEVDARSLDDQFVHEVARIIKEHIGDTNLSVEMLAQGVGYSRSQLTRKLRAVTGKTPNALISEMRLNEARRQLERRQGSVSEIAYRLGFNNMSYFAKRYKARFGVLPSEVEAKEES